VLTNSNKSERTYRWEEPDRQTHGKFSGCLHGRLNGVTLQYISYPCYIDTRAVLEWFQVLLATKVENLLLDYNASDLLCYWFN
jgi:hypothetical protein